MIKAFIFTALLMLGVFLWSGFQTVRAGEITPASVPASNIKEVTSKSIANLTYPSYTAAKVCIEGRYFAVVYSDVGIAICPW